MGAIRGAGRIRGSCRVVLTIGNCCTSRGGRLFRPLSVTRRAPGQTPYNRSLKLTPPPPGPLPQPPCARPPRAHSRVRLAFCPFFSFPGRCLAIFSRSARLPSWARAPSVRGVSQSYAPTSAYTLSHLGKSSLVVQFIENHFIEDYYPTIEVRTRGTVTARDAEPTLQNTFTKTIVFHGSEYEVSTAAAP